MIDEEKVEVVPNMSSRLFLLGFLILVLLTGCGSPAADIQSSAPAAPAEASPAPSSDSIASAEPLLPNELHPSPGIVVGGQPTAEQLQRMADEGYRTVVNLRMPDERGNVLGAAESEALGMTYYSLPMNGGATEEQARLFSEILATEDALPAVVHCAAGGRVGAIFALEAFWVGGATPDAALEIGRKAGMDYMEPTVRKILTEAGSPPS